MQGTVAIDKTDSPSRTTAKSESIRRTAATLLPLGVSSSFCPWYQTRTAESPKTFFWHGAGLPIIARAKGGSVVDVDGNEYVDLIGGHGALILGHADERVVAAISKAASRGNGYGAPSEMEVRLAELIVGRLPAIDMVQFVHTPFDALVFAVHTARGLTERRHIVTFEDAWHSHVGSEILGRSMPVDALKSHDPSRDSCRLVLPFDDAAAVEDLFRLQGSDVAAVVVEPFRVNGELLQPAVDFLAVLRSLCDTHDALLVFDETVTGFRVAAGGVAATLGVLPDLTLLGPVVGGGLPLAACGGRKDVLKELRVGERRASLWPRCDSASESALALAAGIATLQAVAEDDFYEDLEAKSARLHEGLCTASSAACVPVRHVRFASILGFRFDDDAETGGADLSAGSSAGGRVGSTMCTRFFQEMLNRGVLLPPSPAGCLFVSAAHTEEDIDRVVDAAQNAFQAALR